MADKRQNGKHEEHDKQQPPKKKVKDSGGEEEEEEHGHTDLLCPDNKACNLRMHAIQHIDIPCKDLERIRKFYSDVFGWTSEVPADICSNYALWKTPAEEAAAGGGFYIFEGDIPPKGISLHINVEDIDSTLETVKKHGGSVTKEKFLIHETVGYNAFFKDTEGNEMGLYSLPDKKSE